MATMDEEKLPERQKLLESLKDATRRRLEEEAAKKRDSKCHSENIKAIKDEIVELMDQLKLAGKSE